MRRLILLRHGKAVPHDAAPDFDRGLTARGQRDSAAAGHYLADEHLIPDLALVSPASRTMMTWAEAQKPLGQVETRPDKALYLASSDALLREIRAAPDSVMTLIVVGHNPSLHDLAIDLVGYGDRYAMARLREQLPTAGIVVLDSTGESWTDLALRSARLDRFRTPESLGED